MSFNKSHADGGVILFSGEMILLYCDGVEMAFDGPNVLRGTKKGKIYLTTHRVIFTNSSKKDPLQSFSTPFMNITSVGLEQPAFGANYIRGSVTAQEDGNWTGTATFKLKFMKGGAIEFSQAMLRASEMAAQHTPPRPPPYFPFPSQYGPASPPAYTPPPQGYQGFVIPTQMFPDVPPADSVFVYSTPPPYPGINSDPMFVAAPGTAQTAFMNPYAPSNAYMMNYPPPYGAPVPPPIFSVNAPTTPPSNDTGAASTQRPSSAYNTSNTRVDPPFYTSAAPTPNLASAPEPPPTYDQPGSDLLVDIGEQRNEQTPTSTNSPVDAPSNKPSDTSAILSNPVSEDTEPPPAYKRHLPPTDSNTQAPPNSAPEANPTPGDPSSSAPEYADPPPDYTSRPPANSPPPYRTVPPS